MGKFGQHLRFVDEALQASVKSPFVIGRANGDGDAVDASGNRRWHEFLQRDNAIKRGVFRQVDDAETAFTDQADDFKVGNPRADRQTVGVGSEKGIRRTRHSEPQ